MRTNEIIELIDPYTGDQVRYAKTDYWQEYPGQAGQIPMSDSYVDGIIYKKYNNLYYKRVYEDAINVKWFGAIGDGYANDTTAFQDALALLHKFRRGVLFCPMGTYQIAAELEITIPWVGIKGEGMHVTRLIFSSNGIKLMDATQLDWSTAYAAIEDITLQGIHANKGIIMNNSHYYFFNRIWIRDFDMGIDATTSQYVKLNDFVIAGCRVGAKFSNSSFFVTMLNGNINGCTEAGVIETESELFISMTDIEAVPTAIVAGLSTTVKDCHFEQGNIGIAINSPYGKVVIDNCFFTDYTFGIKTTYPGTVIGRYYFSNLSFAICTTEIDIPNTGIYEIDNCSSAANEVMTINSSEYSGAIKAFQYSNEGQWIYYSKTPGIKVNGREVLTGYLIEDSVPFGTIAANSSNQFFIDIPAGSGVNSTTTTVSNWTISNFDITPGLIFSVFVVATPPNTWPSQIGINVTNTTGSNISIGNQTVAIKSI